MIKKIVFSLLFVWGICFSSCSRGKTDVQLDSFYGVKFGSPVSSSKDLLQESGWQITKQNETIICLENKNETFFDFPIDALFITIDKNCIDGISYNFKVNDQNNWDSLKKRVISAYNLILDNEKEYTNKNGNTFLDSYFHINDDPKYTVIISSPKNNNFAFIALKPSSKIKYPNQIILKKVGRFDRGIELSDAIEDCKKNYIEYAIDNNYGLRSLTITRDLLFNTPCDYVQYDFKEKEGKYYLVKAVGFVSHTVTEKELSGLLGIWKHHYGNPQKIKQTIRYYCTPRDSVGIISYLTDDYPFSIVVEAN